MGCSNEDVWEAIENVRREAITGEKCVKRKNSWAEDSHEAAYTWGSRMRK